MKQLLPTLLYAVEIPEDAYDLKLIFYKPYIQVDYRLPSAQWVDRSGGLALFYKDFGGKAKYPKLDQIKILGEVTQDSISFDVTPFISRVINTLSDSPIYENYEFSPKDGNYDSVYVSANSFTSATESFYSLLRANGFKFDNKAIHPNDVQPTNSLHYDRLWKEWQKAENNLVKKLLILQPI